MFSYVCFFFFTMHILEVLPYCGIYQHSTSYDCWILFYCIDMPCFVYQFISWWTFGFSPFCAITKNVAIGICVQIFVWTYVFISFWCKPKVKLLGHMIKCLTFYLCIFYAYHFEELPTCFPKFARHSGGIKNKVLEQHILFCGG